MSLDSYAISLEHYVKSYVSYKALATAKERGTYDKAIMRFVLEFTRLTSPKRHWNVGRSQLVEDMTYVVGRFNDYGAILLDGTAFAFRCGEGYWRVLFARDTDVYTEILSDVPNAFYGSLSPRSDYIPLKGVEGNHAITAVGDRIDFDYHVSDTIVNALYRTIILVD